MSETADNARRTGPALEAMYQFLLWMVPAIDKFPRNQKFVLGDRIETAALDVLKLPPTHPLAPRRGLAIWCYDACPHISAVPCQARPVGI